MVYGIADLLNQWESIGVFDFLLPFLLIFAVVFAILTTTNIFGKSKGVAMVIALTIGLMALRLPFVQQFFTEVFPRFGVALAAILISAILVFLFVPSEHAKGWFIGFAVAGVVFGLITIIGSFYKLSWFGSYWWDEYWGIVIGAIILIILIIALFVSAGKPAEAKGIEIPLKAFR